MSRLHGLDNALDTLKRIAQRRSDPPPEYAEYECTYYYRYLPGTLVYYVDDPQKPQIHDQEHEKHTKTMR